MTTTITAPANPANPISSRRKRYRWRLCRPLVVLALLAAACGGASDSVTTSPATAEPTGAEAAPDQEPEVQGGEAQESLTEDEPQADEPQADEPQAGSGSDDGAVETVADSAESFDVAMEGQVDFLEGDGPVAEGSFTVTAGADELGCSAGTNVESVVAQGVEKLWTCTEGVKSGTIAIVFDPDAGSWEVTAATEDFEGLGGSGDWSGTVDAVAGVGGDSMSGTMSFGNEVRTETAAASTVLAEAATNDLLIDATEIDPAALPFVATVDISMTTVDGDDEAVGCPAPSIDASIWYSFTPITDTWLTVAPEGADFPAGVSAVVAEDSALELLECRPFEFDVFAEAGSTYYFQVFDGEEPDSVGGTLTFRVSEAERSSTDGLAPLGQEFVETVASDIEPTYGAFMLAVVDADGEVAVGTSGGDADGVAPTADDLFRVGSITKVFTAITTMALVEDGSVDLDAAAADYVSRVEIPGGVTVRDLLQHTSGIFDYTEVDGLADDLYGDPGRVWTPEDVMELVADEPSQFEPGSEFGYSNTNYVLLGVLIEEVSGRPYHEVVRERVLEPAEMTSTHLAGFEQGQPLFHPYEHLGNPDYDYTSIATAAWSAGAMVSSVVDLHLMFTALFDGRLVSDELVAEMVAGEQYGLGIDLDLADDGLYGHGGAIDGYFGFVRHSSELGVTAYQITTDAGVNAGYADDKMIEGFIDLAADAN